MVAATEFLRLDRAHGRHDVDRRAGRPAEGSGPTTVTVTLDGLLDDSVRAQRFVLVLSQNDDGEWRLDSAATAQRCQPGRGHQAFSPEPCVCSRRAAGRGFGRHPSPHGWGRRPAALGTDATGRT